MVNDVADIVQDILQGREKGAERLVAEYKDSLYAAALALCGNPATAEDLVSQTFEKVVLKIDTCRDADSFYGWMYAILLIEGYALSSVESTSLSSRSVTERIHPLPSMYCTEISTSS